MPAVGAGRSTNVDGGAMPDQRRLAVATPAGPEIGEAGVNARAERSIPSSNKKRVVHQAFAARHGAQCAAEAARLTWEPHGGGCLLGEADPQTSIEDLSWQKITNALKVEEQTENCVLFSVARRRPVVAAPPILEAHESLQKRLENVQMGKAGDQTAVDPGRLQRKRKVLIS